MKRALILLAFLLVALAAQADRTPVLLARAWPAAPYAGLEDIGTGVGIVFSPDLSVPGNCRFYKALGFACFDSADWLEILSGIHAHNIENPGRRIRTLILETHGTNGNGLKVQTGKKASDARSYISVGALQEWLDPVGVRHVIISACNSGRLLRPEIYLKLNRENGDELFLPATRGIIDASDLFDPKRNTITVITPGASQIETTLVGMVRELAPSTRKALVAAAKERDIKLPARFAISEMFIKMLIRDPALELRTGAWVEELGKFQTSPRDSERIFTDFVEHLNDIAARDEATKTASATASR
ncbi:MAG TPA: hypothetical protein VGQ36_02305 [Thermoanaerobaculia bacterium]|nr:hypothetical protein [Thermoanaerobaculia bacterium]